VGLPKRRVSFYCRTKRKFQFIAPEVVSFPTRPPDQVLAKDPLASVMGSLVRTNLISL